MRSIGGHTSAMLRAATTLLFVPVTLSAAENTRLAPSTSKQIDFDRDIRPILSERCWRCHGPEKQKSQLRLDSRSAALKGGESGEPAIIPGKSAESLLIRLVAGLDGKTIMPPTGERLTAEQVGLLRAWIDQGAEWEVGATSKPADEVNLTTDHWSLQPVKPVPLPTDIDPAITNPIDAFVKSKLKSVGLESSPPADRVSLIRRLYLDMLGLVPTPEEIRAFVEDADAGAYERLVDRVLASPRYGERWARHWLDVVRFGETHGFEKNTERRNAYRYRDYVIQSLNSDKPYDRFVFEQIAGDTVGEDAATGFLVGGTLDQVTSPDPVLTAQQRQDELADMISTTGTAFLGLTVGCARCHNHKFDPIVQKDYYAMQAVFAGVRHGERTLHNAEYDRVMEQVEEVRHRIDAKHREFDGLPLREPINPQMNVERFEPVTAHAVRFQIFETRDGSGPCIDELEVWTAPESDQQPRNVALGVHGPSLTASATYNAPDMHSLAFLNDNRSGNNHSWISNVPGSGWVQIDFENSERINEIVWGRDREGKYQDRVPLSYAIEVADDSGHWRTVAGSYSHLSLTGVGENESSPPPPGVTAEQFAKAKSLVKELADLKTQEQKLLDSTPQAYAGRFEQPETTKRLFRGDVTQPREPVAPEALTVLVGRIGSLGLEMSAPERERRVRLARWIIHPENPLTARVMVNRIWHYHFGAGIVTTPSDFGKMGAPPTHPELLDWLTAEFVRSGWSIKHLHRLILLSATYQQSSRPNGRGLEVDSDCRLLWRFPPRRLEAEAIHDCILQVSGVLNTTMYGPGFSPFEPNDNYVRVYKPKEHFGADDWRRMVYALKVRMVPDGVFGAFDCPDAGQVCPKRSRSTTPIQSLNLFNSPFMIQQAGLFADRLKREAGPNAVEQIRRAFLLAVGRDPDDEEARAARKLVDEHGLAALCRSMFNANEFLFVP